MTLIRADTRYTRTPLCRNFSNFSPCKSPAINACFRPSLALLNIKCMFACHQRPLLGLGTLISTLISLTNQICITDSAPDFTRLINTGRVGRLNRNCISHPGLSFMATINNLGARLRNIQKGVGRFCASPFPKRPSRQHYSPRVGGNGMSSSQNVCRLVNALRGNLLQDSVFGAVRDPCLMLFTKRSSYLSHM